MSATAADRARELSEHAQDTIRLLRVYTRKLTRWADEAGPLFALGIPSSGLVQEIARKTDALSTHRDRFSRIHPACQDLSGIGSGLVEGSNLEYLLRTEVRLRLAEFENAMERYRLIVQGDKKPSPAKADRRVAAVG